MYVQNDDRLNRLHRLSGLGASLMTRDVACGGYYPPGSAMWNSWGCGATAKPVTAPAPSTREQPVNVVIPAAPPPPAPSYITVDNAASRAAEAQYAARQQAEIAASEAAKEAARARAEAEAAKNAPLVATGQSYVTEGGLAPVSGGGYSSKTAAPVTAQAPPAGDETPWWMWAAGLVAVGFVALQSNGRRAR